MGGVREVCETRAIAARRWLQSSYEDVVHTLLLIACFTDAARL